MLTAKPTPDILYSLADVDPLGSYTYADYLRWQFVERVELIRGRVFNMSPAPNLLHQKVSREISRILFVAFHQKPCQVFAAPFDVRLPVGKKKGEYTTVVQPDLCIVCDANKLDEQGCIGAPDLAVEILSPGNSRREMRDKYQLYEEAGVREYWIVNPQEKVVLVYVLNEQGEYVGKAPVTEEDVLRSDQFAGLEIAMKEVFA